MELHMSALQAKQEGESLLKQQITELSSKVEGLQDDLYKQQAFGESLQAERDELRAQSSDHEAEVERLRESMAALSQVCVALHLRGHMYTLVILGFLLIVCRGGGKYVRAGGGGPSSFIHGRGGGPTIGRR